MNKHEIFKEIAQAISAGNLAFPTHAGTALRLRDTLSDPECHIDKASRLVQAEPLLAARIVALANSVAYNPYGREISDLKSAIARLGFSTLRTLSMALVTQQMAGTLPDRTQQIAKQLWEHTAHVAALARILARRVTHVDPEAAMFAGIVHEIGGFFILSRMTEHPDLLTPDLADWIEMGESTVGRALVKALGIPQNIQDALETYWDGFLALPPSGLGDTLLLADELATIASPLHQMATPEAPRYRGEIDILIGEELLTEILQESQDEVNSLCNALNL